MKRFFIPTVLVAAAIFSSAASGQECEMRNLADTLACITEGRITVNRPDGLENKIWSDTVSDTRENELKPGKAVVKKVGYRIQVYSDNHPRLAKSNTSRIANQISAAYPLMRTYLVYKAPYWRLKAGDFIEREAAVEAMMDIKRKFPSLAAEMIVVRDRVNVIE